MKKFNFYKQFKNKKVLVTGHTGFKGSWLTSCLVSLGAKVTGISINIPSKPSHFEAIKLQKRINHKIMDIRNLKLLKKTFKKYQPDYVFHLAAQALVKKSYSFPAYTWETNTIGTLNVLESLREIKKNCTAVLITSDKSYKNLEIKRGYKENDVLGGKDPYSASKASAELVIQSYISSFFPLKKTKVIIGIARAGNVIGGGDWSENRLIPDCVRSWSKNKKVLIRNPQSTRPWQHVLETVWGYLILASNLKKNKKFHGEVFNFGPGHRNNYSVIFLVKIIGKYWKKISWRVINNKKKFHESKLLKLNCNKAKTILKWKCILSLKETIRWVADWYKNYYSNPKKIYQTSFNQISEYEKLLKKRSIE
tara:strand:+ start:4629 stop:5723 length:1095 start_codon:yes stop_codon:yes gene_type:complete